MMHKYTIELKIIDEDHALMHILHQAIVSSNPVI